MRRWLLLMAISVTPAVKAGGLDFGTYMSIQRQMQEGEVLAAVGAPDLSVEQGFSPERLPIRIYSYIATPEQPYTTTVTFVGGASARWNAAAS